MSDLVHPDGTVEAVGQPQPLFDTGLEPTTLDAMATMMEAVVDYGTAAPAAADTGSGTGTGSAQMAGKTGSAQWSDDLDRTHALFAGFYPRSSPRLAIAVIIERGGSGGNVAAAIAHQVFTSEAVGAYLAEAERVDGGAADRAVRASAVASLVGERDGG